MREERRAAARVGDRAEEIVRELLEQRGYVIVETNARVGRAEIDIIARRGRTLVFCEVRARTSARGPHPFETIDLAKRRRLRRAALAWMIERELRGHAMRFDAAAVLFETPGCPVPRSPHA